MHPYGSPRGHQYWFDANGKSPYTIHYEDHSRWIDIINRRTTRKKLPTKEPNWECEKWLKGLNPAPYR